MAPMNFGRHNEEILVENHKESQVYGSEHGIIITTTKQRI